MSLSNVLIFILILMLIGVLPTWPHTVNFGYEPAGALLIIILILLVFRVLK